LYHILFNIRRIMILGVILTW